MSLRIGDILKFDNDTTYALTWNDELGGNKCLGPWKISAELSYIPKKVIVNGKSVVCIWEDDSKTVVHCAEDEHFTVEVGIAECIAKKVCGSRMAFLRLVQNAYIQPEKKVKNKKESQDAL